MSNRDDDFNFDDDFGDDDLFGDDDFLADDNSGAGFDDFSDFDNDEDPFADFDAPADSGAGDFGDFDFDDDQLGNVDDLDDGGFGLDPGQDPDIQPEEPTGASSGFRRGLFILGGLLVAQLLVIVLLFFLLPNGDDTFEMTRAAIETQNALIIADATGAAGTQFADQTGTAIVEAFTDTPSPSPTNTRPPTFTPSPTTAATDTPDPTELAILGFTQTAAAEERLTAQALTEQAGATEEPTDTPEDTGISDVNATATALALLFGELTATADARGDEEPPDIMTPVPTVGEGLQNQGQLPDAGLFDDFAAGNSLGMIALAAFGLLGVIAFSRRMRAHNERQED